MKLAKRVTHSNKLLRWIIIWNLEQVNEVTIFIFSFLKELYNFSQSEKKHTHNE